MGAGDPFWRQCTKRRRSGKLTLYDRYKLGYEAVRDILSKVWIWIIIGIALGALIHGYVPEDMMVDIMGADAWWSVPAAVVMGVPLYTNAAVVIPSLKPCWAKAQRWAPFWPS